MFKEIIDKINYANTVGIFAHNNPDGDALGSMFSFKKVLETIGKRGEVYVSGDVEPKAWSLISNTETSNADPEQCDLLIAFDSADIKRLGLWEDVFKNHPNTIAVDHHKTHIPYAGITVTDDLSSVCELVYKLYKEMGIELNADIASCLYLGIATDSGSFKYSSVTGDTYRIAGELVDIGADFSNIAKVIFDTKSKEYLGLYSLAVSRLQFYHNNKIAILRLSGKDFDNYSIDESSASAIVVLPISVEGVEVGIYIRERADGTCKFSLRSNKYIDVADIASKFNGGGHMRASGFSIKTEEVDKKTEELVFEISKRL